MRTWFAWIGFISNLLGVVKLLVQSSDFSQASRILSEPVFFESDSKSDVALA
jgi:hypothetical protein